MAGASRAINLFESLAYASGALVFHLLRVAGGSAAASCASACGCQEALGSFRCM